MKDVKKQTSKDYKFFTDVQFFGNPENSSLVVFSCDDRYFNRFGKFNILSALKVGMVPHPHIINPGTDTLIWCRENLESKNISYSTEYVDFFPIDKNITKTYYYCSRFFISLEIFNKFDVDMLYISDSDVIFNEKITFPNKRLGVFYFPEEKSNWKKTSATFMFVGKSKKDFLKKVITNYDLKLTENDFSLLNSPISKHEKGDILGLDQVCMSLSIDLFLLNDKEFLNLCTEEKLLSKFPNEAKMWHILKFKKTTDITSQLESKFTSHND